MGAGDRLLVIGDHDLEVVALRRQSSVVTLAAHGVLDADQVAAAFRFRNAFEIHVDAKRESIGFNEWQSPGKPSRTLVESRLVAEGLLLQARDLLGSHGYMLVGKVCGEGFHLHDMYSTQRQRNTMVDMLKLHLRSLAELWKTT